MSRPRLPIGTAGAESVREMPDGKWRARCKYRGDDGKVRQLERFRDSKAKALTALRSAVSEAQENVEADIRPSMTLQGLSKLFLQEKEREKRSAGTLETYRYTADKHLASIGDLTIREATPQRLQKFLYMVEKDHGHGAAKNCRSVLSGMMALAVRNGAAKRNPVRELARIEKKGKVGSEALQWERREEFVAAVHSDEYLHDRGTDDLLEFLTYTGWRVGESCALEWPEVDFDANSLTMNAISVRRRGVGTVRQEFGKTENATRTTAMPQALRVLLERLKAEHGEDNILVFPTPMGGLREPSNVEKEWRSRRDELGFPGVTTHSLRKMVATVLDDQGMSARDIADYLGHKNPSMTEDVYMARNTGSKKAAAAMNNAFSTN